MIATVIVCGSCCKRNYVQYVDTRIGTDSNFALSHGNTYPMTARPFAMHGWSPQTGLNGDGWKYTYPSDEIRGFEQVHQCSPWMNDYAVFSLMPEISDFQMSSKDRGAKFSHDNEIAQVSYYAVTFDNGIKTEIAPGERSAHMRFTYPAGHAYIILDGYTDDAKITVDPLNNRITGWVNNVKFIQNRSTFKSWFVIQFDKQITESGFWSEADGYLSYNHHGLPEDSTAPEDTTLHKGGAWLAFDGGQTVTAKIGSSYISLEQAQLNLDRELGQTFEETRKEAEKVWNETLGQVDVKGATDEEIRTFYSCLWRSNLFSRKLYEFKEDGTPYYYSPYDGLVHDGYMYTDNGFWDTFRSQFPLSNILHPSQQGEYMQALLAAQKECGWLPSWSQPGETGGMLGNHSISLLCDAWAKGIRTFDPRQALEAYEHEVMNKGPWGGANGRAGYQYYWTIGYVPFPQSHGSTAQTLEYAYDDFCAYHLAEMTGNRKYMDMFKDAMYNYRNVFDPETGFMRGKDVDGNWIEPFDKCEWGGPYTEGNAWHYNWSVFQDVQGFIDLYGSDSLFVAKLDSVYSEPNRVNPGWYGGMIHEMVEMQNAEMGQYAHGNQPIQHMPYLYSYAGQPWKTQYWVRQIMSRLYNPGPDGYPGDEDQGGMSSWYTLSALGLYAVTPGTDQYVIGSPVFRDAKIRLENGKTFRIIAKNNSKENVYIQSAALNGKNLDKNWISYYDIIDGGTLELVMGPEPDTERNTTKDAAPFSLTPAAGNSPFCNPVIRTDAADPSILNVNGTFYAVGSSYQWTPSYPIYKSTDLINWVQVGNVLDEKPEWADGGFWAPELFEHNGKFYCYYSIGRKSDGKHCIALAVADKPEGPYTDKGVIYDAGTEQIDAYVFDDNGRLYITWKCHGLDKCPIECECSRLADDGMTFVGETFAILTDTERIGMEGQAMFKVGEWYYVLYSARGCCGPGSDYEVREARARSVEGPWEKYDGNPILMGDSAESAAVGHGSIIKVGSRLFYLSHIYCTGDEFNLGRRPSLHELVQTEDGWIKPITGKFVAMNQRTPFPGTVQEFATGYEADFKAGSNSLGLPASIANAPFDISWTKPNIEVKDEQKYAANSSVYNVECQRQFCADYDVNLSMSCKAGEETGIVIFGSYNDFVALTVADGAVVLKSVVNGEERELQKWAVSGAKSAMLTASVSDVTNATFSWKIGKESGSYDMPVPLSYLNRWDSAFRVGMISTAALPGPVEKFEIVAR